jgi:hypothetical protein
MTAQAVAAREAIIEKLREEFFVLSQCNHAIANVTRREYAEITSQAAGASAFVSNCYDGSQCRNLGTGTRWVVGCREVAFQTT